MQYTTTHLAGVFNLDPSVSDALNPQDWFLKALGITASDAGVDVDAATALTSGAIWEAVNIISGDVGMLPIHVYDRIDDDNKKINRDHDASRLLRREPHPEIRPMQFRERMTSDALLWGNGIAFITRNRGGQPINLVPTEPSRTRLTRDKTGELLYITLDDKGNEWTARKDDVLHIVGYGSGTWGINVFEAARNSWGMHLALQKHGNRVFKNGAVPDGVLSTDVKLTANQSEGIRREWNQVHQGAENSGKIAVLGRGTTYMPITIPNRDAEWLGSLRYSREDVACWFLMPAHKLNSMENSSVRANIEERNREYLQQCLSHWLTRWEQECEKKLLTRQEFENETTFIRFNTGGLLKGDFKSQVDAIQVARQAEVYSINDGRRKLDENTIGPEGDVYRNPATSSDAGQNANQTDDTGSEQSPADNEAARNETAIIRLAIPALARIQTIERRAILRAAKKPETFTESVADFYDKTRPTFAEILEPTVSTGITLAVTPSHVSTDGIIHGYVNESYDRIVTACGVNGDVYSAADAETKTWDGRRDATVATILGKGSS